MKILMVLMGLDIGGAETHVVELAKELKKQGHDVSVASGGGAYVTDITTAGIQHFFAPLKKHSDMLRAYFIMRRIIKEVKPDIVHAHARLPAFICHLVHKTGGKFAFVTSVHGTYDTNGLMGKLSRWGSRQMAVSEDIKRYLLQNYKKVKAQNVYVSVNGVDTDKYSAEVSADKIIKEFSLNPNAERIGYVSRLDSEVCAGAFALLRLAPRLIEHVPNLEIIITGDGTSFDEPTSRSALEEMAQEKPCIMAGSFGYMGIFSEEKLVDAVGNNFTCRGTHPINDDELFDDIMKLHNMTQEERAALGAYSRSVVVQHYSLRKMTNDNLKMYEDAVTDGKFDAAILGYYGFRNSGDDTLLHAIIGSLKKREPNVRIAVFSNSPEETARIYGVHAVNRFDYFAARKVLKHTKLFIMGGGSLLQDGTSRHSLLYYTTFLNTAKKLCKKTMLYANGIGPFLHKGSVKLTAKALRGVDVITLRDKDSADDLKKMGIPENAFVTADPVFTLRDNLPKRSEYLPEVQNLSKDDKYVCVSPRNFGAQPANFEESFASMCDYIASEYGYKIVLLPMQYPYDAKICRSIQAKMKEDSIFIASRLQSRDMLSIISGCEFAVGVRLHLLIYASTVAVPGIGIVYDPKVSSFQRYINQPYYIEPRGLSSGSFFSVIDECVKNRAETAAKLAETAEIMQEKAEKTADIAIKFIREY